MVPEALVENHWSELRKAINTKVDKTERYKKDSQLRKVEK